MNNNLFKGLRVLAAALTFAAVFTGCAVPKQGPEFQLASDAIRAAQNAGALEHAPEPYGKATDIYSKAEAMNANRRSNRAQKLLELATAQANLAQAMSEAAHAESSLTFIRAGLPR